MSLDRDLRVSKSTPSRLLKQTSRQDSISLRELIKFKDRSDRVKRQSALPRTIETVLSDIEYLSVLRISFARLSVGESVLEPIMSEQLRQNRAWDRRMGDYRETENRRKRPVNNEEKIGQPIHLILSIFLRWWSV
jgi:hypothetical protein